MLLSDLLVRRIGVRVNMRAGKFIQSWWGVGLFAVLIGVIAYQAVRLHNRPVLTVRPEPRWKVGGAIAGLTGERIGGRPKEAIDLTGETILYVMSPTCTWCTRNLDNARVLHQGSGKKFIALSTTSDGLGAYIQQYQIAYPVFHKVSDLGVSSTPTTLLVQDGVIQQVWGGAWAKENKMAIEKQFSGLILPGLSE